MCLRRLIGGACLAAVTAACGGDHGVVYSTQPTPLTVIGSGRMTTETRPVAPFDSIGISAGLQAIVVMPGSESLEITAEDNILPLVDAAVIDGRLNLGWRPGTGSVTSHGVICRVGARMLRGLKAAAGSRIQVDGIEATDFDIDLSGAASFTGSGTTERLRIDLSGASRLQAPGLTARAADAVLSGASVALVRVVDAVVVHASGASIFEFLGNPAVQADSSGSSIVRRVGP